jgi:acyl-CoA dehydrogenase
VHKVTLARKILRDYEASDDLFPTRHIPKLREAALTQYAEVLAKHGANA